MGTNLRRTPQSGGLSIKGDIIDTKPGQRAHEYHYEIKNHKTIKVKDWLMQAESDCGKKMPVVIFARLKTVVMPGKPPVNEKKWYVITELEHWAEELENRDAIETLLSKNSDKISKLQELLE